MTRHEELVGMLIANGCHAGPGFVRQLRRIPSSEMEDDRRFLYGRWPRPDAWRIDAEARDISIYEVEDTHPMTDDVLRDWSVLWHFLDTYDWNMRLLRVARWAQIDEVKLPAVYAYFHLENGGTRHAANHGKAYA